MALDVLVEISGALGNLCLLFEMVFLGVGLKIFVFFEARIEILREVTLAEHLRDVIKLLH